MAENKTWLTSDASETAQITKSTQLRQSKSFYTAAIHRFQ